MSCKFVPNQKFHTGQVVYVKEDGVYAKIVSASPYANGDESGEYEWGYKLSGEIGVVHFGGFRALNKSEI